jgi:hypothetical protein
MSLVQKNTVIDRVLDSHRNGLHSNVNVLFVVLSPFLFSTWLPRLQPRLVLLNLGWATFRLLPRSIPCLSRVLPLRHLVLHILLSLVVVPTLVSLDQKQHNRKNHTSKGKGYGS